MSAQNQIKNALEKSITISSQKAATAFKTGKGEYAEGDQFIGVTVLDVRKIAKQFKDLHFDDLKIFLSSKINQERFLALVILVEQYKKADVHLKKKIYDFYVDNMQHVNNWNLVDASAHHIVGTYLWDKDKTVLFEMAQSNDLWCRRIAIVATWYFIRQGDLQWTFKIANMLMNDDQDLMHKATGWMLREAGKVDKKQLVVFLDSYSSVMPRTMLRYAIERFSKEERTYYMQK